MIVLAPVQISERQFGHFGLSDLKHFLNSCIDVAELETDSLFILKEKKGNWSSCQTLSSKGVTICKMYLSYDQKLPKFNKFNQFEDVIKISDLPNIFVTNINNDLAGIILGRYGNII